MKYPLIAKKVASEVWSLEPSVFAAIIEALHRRDMAHPGAPVHPIGERSTRTIGAFTGPEDDHLDDEIPGSYAMGPTRVIPLHGIIGKHLSAFEMECGGCSLDLFCAMLDEAVEDDAVSSIVLDINSPGGVVVGVPEAAAKIRAAGERKPVIAFTDYQACSAALWLAHSASAFYATGSAHVGSVGAYIMLMDASAWYAKAGLKPDPIVNGEFKLAGADFRPLTDAERSLFQSQVDRTVAQFKAAVTAGHDIADEDLQGQVYPGEIALEKGYLDGLADSVEEVVEIARDAAFSRFR